LSSARNKIRVPHTFAVPALLLLAGVLAATSLVRDSITYDETSHLTAGMSYLRTGDFRLAPDHPPLAKVWCAWPLLFMNQQWPPADNPHWLDAQVFGLGRDWLFRLNDGQRLLVVGRCMMVILFLATCLTTYALARRLFGPAAALLALILAALSPTLLAHGRLVTTDMPITLLTALALLTFARLMERSTWPRLLAAAATLAAASVTKFSWPLVVPALVVMAAWTAFRRAPEAQAARSHLERVGIVVGSIGFIALLTWLSIWTCYGWRTTIIASPTASGEPPSRTELKLALDWQVATCGPDGTARAEVVPTFLRYVADRGWLPDAYLLGLAQTFASSQSRAAFLLGDYSTTGWRSYFPVAFAIKTPLATLILLLAGIVALARRRARARDLVLLAGLVTFVVLYAGYVINSRLNIGHRHLLPLYPLLFVIAGAASAWWASRAGRWLVRGGIVWLAGANACIYPHYLAYFNELVGGPANGRYYLVDSNLDWGQDLLRLAAYARRHPLEPIKFAYFGSGLPTYYLPCTALPSNDPFEPRAELTQGTYVVSLTQLSGVYDREIRDEFWTEIARHAYAELARIAAIPGPADESTDLQKQRAEAKLEYADLRVRRLINRLAHRSPDERIGYSLFVFRLSDVDVGQLTLP
jgi:4-amino-4-deoxy-L-arabinose transferase-like glycosyltransferase